MRSDTRPTARRCWRRSVFCSSGVRLIGETTAAPLPVDSPPLLPEHSHRTRTSGSLLSAKVDGNSKLLCWRGNPHVVGPVLWYWGNPDVAQELLASDPAARRSVGEDFKSDSS